MSSTVKDEYFFNNIFFSYKDPWYISLRISQQHRYITILNMLIPFLHKNSIGLDIGCALGDFTQLLSNSNFFKSITGIDISEIAIKQAKERFRKDTTLQFQYGNLLHLDFKTASFNSVTLLEVLYYLPKQDQITALNKINQILTPDGIIALTVNLGPIYFSKDKLITLLRQSGFFIKKIEFSHGKIHLKIEKILLKWYEFSENYKNYYFVYYLQKIIRTVLKSKLLLKITYALSYYIKQEPLFMYVIAQKR